MTLRHDYPKKPSKTAATALPGMELVRPHRTSSAPKKAPSVEWEDFVHYTRSVPNEGLSPSQRIVQHYEALLPKLPAKNNSIRGQAWERCIYDALIHFGVKVDAIHVDMVPGANAEADIVVIINGLTYAIMAKTSFRERWKQIDRDAMLIASRPPWNSHIPVCIFYREVTGQTVSQAIELAASKLALCQAKSLRIMTALDENAMNILFKELGADI